MVSSGGKGQRTNTAEESFGGVEEMLRVAEDDLLLKLSVNTHTTTTSLAGRPFPSSSSSLDPDLARRFDALKSPPAPTGIKRAPPVPPSQESGTAADGDGRRVGGREDEEELSRILGDDLSARFAALKGSSSLPVNDVQLPRRISTKNDDDDEDDDDGVSKKEVDKLMQWAIDAARLDPSRSDDDEEVEEGVEGEEEVKEEKITKGKPKTKKWFLF